MDNWTDAEDIESLLENIRINAINLSNYHRYRYFHFKAYGKYFRIPIIVLSSITSAASVGLQPFMTQGTISGMTCLLGFIIAVVSSTEMYLKITDQQEKELSLSKDYYSLGVDIFKLLATDKSNRSEDARAYLDKRYSEYKALTESSSLLKNDLRVDCLAQVPDEYNNSLKPKPERSLFLNESPHIFPKLKPLQEQCKPLELKNISFAVDDKPITSEHLSVTINTPQGSPKSRYEEIKQDLSIELAKIPPVRTNSKTVRIIEPIRSSEDPAEEEKIESLEEVCAVP